MYTKYTYELISYYINYKYKMEIQGLYQVKDFITTQFEQELLDWIDKQTWSTKLKRRTQHYNYEYNYITRQVSKCSPFTFYIKELSDFLSNKLHTSFDQCIVNEYVNDQGITPHIDANIFDNVIVCLSLGSQDEMIFSKDNSKHTITLYPRSLLIMTNEARYDYKHEIKSKIRSDNFRRISITFRKVK